MTPTSAYACVIARPAMTWPTPSSKHCPVAGRQMISRAEYDQRKATLDSASAAQLARQELEYTNILAPFDAVVASTHVDNFQVVQAKQPVVTLQSGNQLDVLFPDAGKPADQPAQP